MTVHQTRRTKTKPNLKSSFLESLDIFNPSPGKIIPNIFFDVSDDDGTSEPPVDPATEFKTLLDARTKEHAKTKAALEKTITDLQSRLEKLEKPNPTNPEPPIDTSTDGGRLRLLEIQYKKDMEKITGDLNAAKQREEQEKSRRQALEIGGALRDALVSANCKPDAFQVAESYLRSSIKIDDEDGSLYFELKGGGQVSVTEGVSAELPEFLREPIIKGTGSGAKSGNVAQRNEIATLEAEILKMEKSLESNRTDTAVVQLRQAKKRLTALKTSLK